jgi:hypothetical protein
MPAARRRRASQCDERQLIHREPPERVERAYERPIELAKDGIAGRATKWILSSTLAPSALSTATPSEYVLEVRALDLPSIAIVRQSGSPQRTPLLVRRTRRG